VAAGDGRGSKTSARQAARMKSIWFKIRKFKYASYLKFRLTV